MKSLSPKKFLSEALTPRTKKQSIEFHLWRAESELSPKTRRLCQWNVDILLRHLKQIVAFRNAAKQSKTGRCQNLTKQEGALSRQRSTINELVEIISLPGFDAEAFKRSQDQNDVELPGEVVNQVKLFVTSIATMYRSNPFHNFDVSYPSYSSCLWQDERLLTAVFRSYSTHHMSRCPFPSCFPVSLQQMTFEISTMRML